MISKVYRICDAYEAGYGKGLERSKDENPYSYGDEHEAWDIGYQKGLETDPHRTDKL